MAFFTRMVTMYLVGKVGTMVASKYGLSEASASGLVQKVVGLFTGATAKNASTSGGLSSLMNALSSGGHDGSVMGNLDQVMSNPEALKGSKIVGHLLGNRTDSVAQSLAADSELDAGQAKDLLATVAPIFMGVLGKETADQGLDAQGLLSQLQSGATEAKEEIGPKGTIDPLMAMLDSDGDGDFKDDLLGMGMSVLKKMM